MKTCSIPIALSLALSCLVSAHALAAGAEPATQAPKQAELFRTVAALDEKLFAAYNACDLKTFRGLLSDDLEFYHDQGGVTWTPDEVTEGVKKYICGKVRRELVPGSLVVDQIKDFGAVELGEHRFCEIDTGKCVGTARFVHVWKNDNGHWLATRIISYAHRPLDPPQ